MGRFYDDDQIRSRLQFVETDRLNGVAVNEALQLASVGCPNEPTPDERQLCSNCITAIINQVYVDQGWEFFRAARVRIRRIAK